VTLLGLLSVLLRRRHTVLVTVTVTLALVVGATLLRPRTFSSSAAFMPQSRRAQNGVGGLAAQFGLNVGVGEPSQSPQFYVDILKSRGILDQLAATRFPVHGAPGDSATLLDQLQVQGETPALRREAGLEELRGRVRTTITQQTGVVGVTFTAPQPALSQQVTARLLELVHRFNLESRRSQASQERQFTASRLAEAREELLASEDRLLVFLQRNRGYSNSPELRFEHDRLEREVSTRQQLFTSLAETYEQARIEEVRDTPVISIVEPPNIPARPDPRGLVRSAALGLLVALALGVMLAFLREYAARSGERAEEFQEFDALRRAAADDLRHPLRAVARAIARR
jgi:uncharacterized protein involved in exopolysaccharide biosynthesis